MACLMQGETPSQFQATPLHLYCCSKLAILPGSHYSHYLTCNPINVCSKVFSQHQKSYQFPAEITEVKLHYCGCVGENVKPATYMYTVNVHVYAFRMTPKSCY